MNVDKKYEILRGLMYGLCNEEIAERVQLSVSRVKQHVYILCQTHGTKSRNGLVSKLYRKIVSDEQIEEILTNLKKADPAND